MNKEKILGRYMRDFRLNVLNKTLQDVQGSSEGIKTLSAFEHGRSTNFNHIFKYINACNTEEQIDLLLDILRYISEVIY